MAELSTDQAVAACQSKPAMTGILWLASYLKSGNTWTRNFLHNLLNIPGGVGDNPQNINRIPAVPQARDVQWTRVRRRGHRLMPRGAAPPKLSPLDECLTRRDPEPLAALFTISAVLPVIAKPRERQKILDVLVRA